MYPFLPLQLPSFLSASPPHTARLADTGKNSLAHQSYDDNEGLGHAILTQHLHPLVWDTQSVVASNQEKKALFILTMIREVMPEKAMVPEKEQVNFKGEDEIEPPTDFVTLGE